MSPLSRRQALVLGLAAAATPAFADPAPGPSLDALARAKGLSFGSAIGTGVKGPRTASFDDPRYRAIMTAECGVMVCENEMKWYALRPDANTFTFERADRLAAFATENHMALRGHNLLWQRPDYFPKWFASLDLGARPATTLEQLLTTHIRTVCTHFPQVVSWDVVNETIDHDTGLMRETVFTKYLGPEVIDIAFHAAREAAPHAQLVYNDYMGWEVGNERHREGVLRLVGELRGRKVPVDALGVQSHIGTNNPDQFDGFGKSQPDQWRAFLDGVTGQGLDLVVTEFDVNDMGLPTDFAARDKAVADYARAYLDIMLSYTQTKAVLAWGIVDSYSWLNSFKPRADGTLKRPTPYDAGYQPKLLRTAIADALRFAPARPA